MRTSLTITATTATNDMTNSGDLELISRLKEGDEGAFEELFTKYRGRLYRLARLYTGGEEALDCVQDAYIYLLRVKNTLQQRDSLFPLLAKMTINRCLEVRRSDKRRNKREEIVSSEEKTEGSPEEILAASELGETLIKALDKLPPKAKACTLLRLETDMTVSEIAEACGVSYLAARLNIHRGISALKGEAERFNNGAEK